MRRRILQASVLLLIFLLAACGSAGSAPTGQSVERQAVIDLVCGSEDQAVCISRVCPDEIGCPFFVALSDQAVYDFVKTYSACDGCNTPDLAPELGIGKCIEYGVSEISSGWAITFWVSGNCSFRYASPEESQIRVDGNSDDMQIVRIQPPVQYIKDPSFCQTNDDCYCLSGSGIPFVGCSNLLYAPLNLSGYYAGEDCGCESNQCTVK